MLKTLIRTDRLLETDPKPRSDRHLRRELGSAVRDRRLIALARIRRQIETAGLRRSYFSMVEPLTIDPDSTCRWQATIIVGEFIDTEPDRVWDIATTLGRSTIAERIQEIIDEAKQIKASQPLRRVKRKRKPKRRLRTART